MLFGSVPSQATDATLQSLGLHEEDIFPEPVDMPSLIAQLRNMPAASRGKQDSDVQRSSLGFFVTGELDDGGLAGVLAAIVRGQGTGQLELEIRGAMATLSFKQGRVIAAKSPVGPLALGPFLVRKQRLTEQALQVLAKQGPISLDVLVAQKILSPHEVLDVAKEQAEAIIHWAVGPGKCSYRWSQGAQPRSGGFPMGIKVERIITDTFKSNADSVLPPQLASQTLNLDPQASSVLREMGLHPLELRVLNLLDGTNTLQSVVENAAGGNSKRSQEIVGFVVALRTMFGDPRDPDAEQVVDWSKKKEEFQQELARMEEADPFDILGVTPETSSSDVRTRFFSLSKQYHPDRAFSAEPEVRELMQSLFRKVQEAYELVTDPKKRNEYLSQKEAEKGGLNPRAAVNAEITFTQGELFLKNKNYTRAKELFAKAANLNPHEPEYRCFLGWATYLDDPTQYVSAVKLINGAVQEHPNLDKGYYFLGCILKARNELSQAEGAFKRAITANPNNVEAKRELRLFGMRREKSGSPSAGGEKKGFFNRFRKS